MRPTQQALSRTALILALIAPVSAWATCTTSVVDLGLLTTVTVTASTDEDCRWMDNNPNNARLLSMVGTAVPRLLNGYSAHFVASSINQEGQKWPARQAKCGVTNIPGCTPSVLLITDDHPSEEGYRDCNSDNDGALSSTTVCVFERIVP